MERYQDTPWLHLLNHLQDPTEGIPGVYALVKGLPAGFRSGSSGSGSSSTSDVIRYRNLYMDGPIAETLWGGMVVVDADDRWKVR